MLDKPDVQDERIISRLQEEYGLLAVEITFLPLGADFNTAVYRVSADDGASYFLKLRRGSFDEMTVVLPRFLSNQRIGQVMAPLTTKAHRLWAKLSGYHLLLYPFANGRNGFEVDLSARQWIELGSVLRRIHHVALPLQIRQGIEEERYVPHWRESVRRFQSQFAGRAYDDPVAAQLSALLKTERDKIRCIVDRAEQLGATLRGRSLELVLCHTDIHAGNVLIGTEGELYIVDWDNPLLAPQERDLMFVGGGVGGVWNRPQEEALFYKGYGAVEIDPIALAYYRYERIVQDIAVTCEQIFLTDEGNDDRELGFRHLANQFLPNNVVEIAHRSFKNQG